MKKEQKRSTGEADDLGRLSISGPGLAGWFSFGPTLIVDS